MRAIAYINGRPFITYQIENLGKLVNDVKCYYADSGDVQIRDESGKLLAIVPQQPVRNPNALALETDTPTVPVSVYVDQFGFITHVLP